MFLSLGRLGIGVNSAASDVRKTNLRVNLDLGGVRMPSMRTAGDNDNIGLKWKKLMMIPQRKKKKRKRREKRTKGKKNKRSNNELEINGR